MSMVRIDFQCARGTVSSQVESNFNVPAKNAAGPKLDPDDLCTFKFIGPTLDQLHFLQGH